MTQNSLFEPIKDQLEQFDETKDYLPELVGPDKKFKDPQALAKGKYQSDLYIKTLEKSLDDMRRDYEEARKQNMAGARLEELITKLNSSQQSDSEQNQNAKDGEQVTPGIKPEDVENIVFKKIQEAKQLDKEQANLVTVQTRLKERFGQNFQTVLEQQRLQLGLDAQDIDALARKSPAAFFRTLGLDQQQQQQDSFQAPPRNQIRNDNFRPSTEKRTWSWYQALKKKDPASYKSPKIIVQMHKDHLELGKEFEDGDYNN